MSASVIHRFFANAGMIAMRAACNAQSRLHRRYEGFSSFHVEANAARRMWTKETPRGIRARRRRSVRHAECALKLLWVFSDAGVSEWMVTAWYGSPN